MYACHLKGLETTSIARSLRVSHLTVKEQLVRNLKDAICVSVACGSGASSILHPQYLPRQCHSNCLQASCNRNQMDFGEYRGYFEDQYLGRAKTRTSVGAVVISTRETLAENDEGSGRNLLNLPWPFS